MKKRTNFGYFIKEGVLSIFTHRLMSFASVCIIIACLLIMGSFCLLAMNVRHIIRTMEDDNQMVAYVDDSYTEGQARALQPRLLTVPNVAKVEFVTRDQAM